MNTYNIDKMYESYSSEVERMQKCINELQQENKQIKIQISAREEVYIKLEDNWNKLKEDYFSYIKICGNEMRSPFDVGNKIFRDLKRRKLLEVNEKLKDKKKSAAKKFLP